jgi:hypothetical protein
MPNNNSPQIEDEADFSSYLKEEAPQASQQNQPPPSPLQDIPASPKFTKRVVYLIIFFVILAMAQVFMLFVWKKNKPPEAPPGYRLVTPPNQPAHIEPIK